MIDQNHSLTNDKAPSTINDVAMKTPAVTLPLTGRHLIEASAGTGKTWTLTGLVLRLIVEAGHPCDKIIATTFTRSAAAEMKQRIRDRLQDFYQLVKLIQGTQFTPLHDNDLKSDRDADVQKYEHFMAQVQDLVTQKNMLKLYEDSINKHLIEWIGKNFFHVPLAYPNQALDSPQSATASKDKDQQQVKPNINFGIALHRTTLALNQLDRLFINTLDSLCQKWLREYSSETGFSADVQISNDVSSIVKGIIHDQLRAFMAQTHRKMPDLYTLMYDYKVFKSVNHYYKAVERALNFYTAEIDPIIMEEFDTSALISNMQAIADYQNPEFETLFDKAVRKKKGFNGRNKLALNFNEIKNLQQFLKEPSLIKVLQFSKVGKVKNLLDGFVDLYHNDIGFDDRINDREYFKSFEIIQRIWLLVQQKQQLEAYFEQVDFYFTQFISRYVRTHLPKRLEAQRLTTFTLQLARLNDALSGNKGESLARFIRHQYPVALIDESQDINTEQALLIQRVYLHDAKQQQSADNPQQSFNQQFLLLVGDPKQAIYGFRGGDVENYTTLKKLFPEPPKALSENYRSSQQLINSLNYWYGVGEHDIDPDTVTSLKDIELKPYYMGNEIFYRRIAAERSTAELYLVDESSSSACTAIDSTTTDSTTTLLPAFNQILIEYNTPYLQVDAKEGETGDGNERTLDFADAIVAQIFALFDQNNTLYYQQRPLLLKDICVLAITNDDLDIVKKRLDAHGIPAVRGGSQSVFSDKMSADLLALLAALLHPYSQSKLRVLMLTNFFQLTLDDVNALYEELTQTDSANLVLEPKQAASTELTVNLAAIQELIMNTSELWQKHSLLEALQWFLNQELKLPNQTSLKFWQRLAMHRQGERLLIDLRQLMDIIADNFTGQVGEYQIYEWFYSQIQQAPKEDWSTQQRLPSEDGIQLMTVHASKGLEFTIVFVVGFTAKSEAKFYGAPLYMYGGQTIQSSNQTNTANNNHSLLNRRLTALPNEIRDNKTIDYLAIENKFAYEEKLRLLYVALTRAKEQVYLVTVGSKSAVESSPLRPFMADLAEFSILDELVRTTNIITINSLSKYLQPNLKFIKRNGIKPESKNINDQVLEETNTDEINYESLLKLLKVHTFKGWGNTSFTALSRYIDHSGLDSAINEEFRQDEAVLLEPVDSSIEQTVIDGLNNELPIRFSFEKGANPGTFLHSILEDIANNYSETSNNNLITDLSNNQISELKYEKLKRWSVMVDRSLRRYQMPKNYFSTQASSEGNYGHWRDIDINELQPDYIQLVEWLDEIIHTPLSASSTKLVDIKPQQKTAELAFNLRLSQHLSFSDLNNLFKEYHIPLQLQSQEINTMIWQYLKGEIDLVYQQGEQFYIVDYKSNFLGSQLLDYHQAALSEVMTSHSYWLQASIYQVALHRYLKLRLPNYDINTHLGAVEYVFLRGMSPKSNDTGKLVKQFDSAFVLKLDEMFGYPNTI